MCWRKKIPTENHIYLNMREQWWRYLKLYKFCYAKRYKVTGPTLYNSLMENPHFWHGSFFFLIMLGSIWDLGSQTRNGTHAHCSISMESYPLDHQESPWHGSLVPHWSEVKIAQSCLTLFDPMNHSTSGLLVHHQLLQFTQTHLHWVSDAIQPSHPLSSPSPPALNLSQHQGLFKWVSLSHQVVKVLEFQLQHQSFQWTPRTDLL